MMSQKQELKDRVQAKKKELQARLLELKADSREAARDSSHRIQTKLDELEETVGDKWHDLTEAVAKKLNRWLEED